MYFNYVLNSEKSWFDIYLRIDVFHDLIKHIFDIENLNFSSISNLKGGSNASFKVGNLVIKIFAPIETGIDTSNDYIQEIFGIHHAIDKGIYSYKLVCNGSIKDKYLFNYMIYEYIDGEMLSNCIKNFNSYEKELFINQLNDCLSKINVYLDFHKPDPIKRSLNNYKWEYIPEHIRIEVFEDIKKVNCSNFVYCHNDITGDNTLWKNNKLYLIDFADGLVCPLISEYTTIVFDLFDFDKELIHMFSLSHDLSKIYEGIIIHEYGYLFLEWIANRLLNKNLNETNLDSIKLALNTFITNCL